MHGWDGTQSVFGVPSYGQRIEHNGKLLCGCYPECRIDCKDREKCLDDMPEYQTKLDKATRYAAAVRVRRPAVRQWFESVVTP